MEFVGILVRGFSLPLSPGGRGHFVPPDQPQASVSPDQPQEWRIAGAVGRFVLQ